MAYLKETLQLELEELLLLVLESLQRFPKWQRVLLIFSLVAIVPGFFITKSITHATSQRQYKQYLISAKPSFSNPKDLTLSVVKVLPVSGQIYSAFAEIQNENLDLSANPSGYEFQFFNSKDELIYTKSGLITLVPNQKTLLVVPRFSSSDKDITAQLRVTSTKWQKRLSIPEVSLETPAPLIKNIANPPSFNLEGAVINRSPYQLGKVTLLFELKDSSGKVVAVSSRDEFTLTPNERRAYVQPWPGLQSSVVSEVVVSTRTNVFDSKNLSSGGDGSSSGLEHPNLR